MDIKKIRDVKLSVMLADFQMCPKCRVVDCDKERTKSGHTCSTCGSTGDGGEMYFSASILLLINLLQEAFYTPENSCGSHSVEGRESHDVSVVLFFCTLREILLNWFVGQLCWAQNIPKPKYEELLADDYTYSKRQNYLLPKLIGKKWLTLVAEESHYTKMDYIELDKFLKKAVKARNRFMHEGNRWGINRKLAEDCLDHTGPLLKFYVALHNRYVHPLYIAKSA